MAYVDNHRSAQISGYKLALYGGAQTQVTVFGDAQSRIEDINAVE